MRMVRNGSIRIRILRTHEEGCSDREAEGVSIRFGECRTPGGQAESKGKHGSMAMDGSSEKHGLRGAWDYGTVGA